MHSIDYTDVCMFNNFYIDRNFNMYFNLNNTFLENAYYLDTLLTELENVLDKIYENNIDCYIKTLYIPYDPSFMYELDTSLIYYKGYVLGTFFEVKNNLRRYLYL